MTSNPLEPPQAEPLPDDLAGALTAARAELDHIGSPVVYLPSTPSTNDVAAQLAEAGGADGTTVVADAQTSGRGRLGRTWFSPAGAGLYVSVIIRPGAPGGPQGARESRTDARVPPPSRLTLLAGVSLGEAVRSSTGLPAEIKWPNDLVFCGKKLAGILAEGALQQGVLEYVILGIGINVRAVSYPPDIAHRASSLEAELGRPVDRGLLLATLLVNLGRARRALREDAVHSWFDRWRALSPSAAGALVEWRAPDGVRRGRTAGLDHDGALLVRSDRGVERVSSGEIIWL